MVPDLPGQRKSLYGIPDLMSFLGASRGVTPLDRSLSGQGFEALFARPANGAAPVPGQLGELGPLGNVQFAGWPVWIVDAAAIGSLALIHLIELRHIVFLPE